MYDLLIVDDEVRIRTGLVDHFPWSELGFNVAGAFPNGKAAKAYIEKHNVDAVLTDIRMPLMDGIELAKFIQEHRPNIITVFLSGYTDFEYARQAIQYSVKEYILKPVKHEQLVSLFSSIKRKLDEAKKNEKIVEESKGYYDRLLEIVKSYVWENFKTASLYEAAVKAELSPNYLSKIFKQKTGKNFSDYVIEVKMKKAAVMLDDIHFKIYHISSEVGYNNPKNFSRAFKSHNGKSPREYREQGL